MSQHTGCYDWAHLCSHLGRLLCVQVASQVYTLSRKIQVNLTAVNSQYILSRGFKDLHNLNKDVHVHVGHVLCNTVCVKCRRKACKGSKG